MFLARPGAELPSLDFEMITQQLKKKYQPDGKGRTEIREHDVQSYVQYPKVFEEFMETKAKYGDLTVLDTRTFVEGMSPQQEVLTQY